MRVDSRTTTAPFTDSRVLGHLFFPSHEMRQHWWSHVKSYNSPLCSKWCFWWGCWRHTVWDPKASLQAFSFGLPYAATFFGVFVIKPFASRLILRGGHDPGVFVDLGVIRWWPCCGAVVKNQLGVPKIVGIHRWCWLSFRILTLPPRIRPPQFVCVT